MVSAWRRRPKVDAQLDESAPTLTPLAPEYSYDTHGVYFTILKRTIEEQPNVRNIALAGPYGTGKSSILRKVTAEFEERVIEVSLLTLGAEPTPASQGEGGNPAAASTTNRIQKEIVKQLLYQQKPQKTAESRFRRIVRYRWGIELLIAGVAGVAAVILAAAAGLDVVLEPTLGLTISGRPHWVPLVALLVLLAILVGTTVLSLRALVRGRLGIEKVTAGPATITLPPRSASYFDEYLDEIIYFFETNPKSDIVILEDLDRFNDPNIFEALRSLNGLLNAAQQLGRRNIRFIYAVRDSVFENLGRDSAVDTGDEARDELVRANRTKFFELVVPVVPFITHKNARDLMHELLTKRGHTISKELVDVAARHLADMRLIHNTVNEYEVFKHRLLDVPTPVPELDSERLFAMVLFKNAHMSDFEKIRHGASSLDKLWGTWRLLVNENLDNLRLDSQRLRSRTSESEAAASYAVSLGQDLRSRVNALAAAPKTGLAGTEIYFAGNVVTDRELQSTEFWKNFLEGTKPLTVSAWQYGTYNAQAMQLSRETLETLLGRPIDGERFLSEVIATNERKASQNEEDITFLRRHSWKRLVEAGRFKYADTPEGVSRSFREWVSNLLPSRLAADLVIHGYITSYFSLHVSAFYGQLIRPDAMIYIMRSIDQGTPDPEYPLDSDDVAAILRDQGPSILSERSMLNIGILDHLLVHRPDGASTVVQNLVDTYDKGPEFIDLYLDSGKAKNEFVEHLAPWMPDIFIYLASSAPLERSERVQLVDTAITSRSRSLRYGVSDALRVLIEAEYRSFASLASGAEQQNARDAVSFIARTRAVVPHLTSLSDPAIEAFRGTRAYALTLQNLECVTGKSNLSLDVIHDVDREVFAYVTESVQAYLAAFRASEVTVYTVDAPDAFTDILNASKSWTEADFDAIVTEAHPSCAVAKLDLVPSASWPVLVRTGRAPMSFANVSSYVNERGEVDIDLAISLCNVDSISGVVESEEDARAQLALDILNSPAEQLSPSQRVKLALSLDPGVLDPNAIQPLAGPLVGELIATGLIPDDEYAFSARLMVDWDTQVHAMTSSDNFADLISPQTLQARFVAPLFRSKKLASLHSLVATALPSFAGVPREAFDAAARRALEGGFDLDASNIDFMRRGGVATEITIELLAEAGTRVSTSEVREILRALGKPWSKVADPGWGLHEVPNSPGSLSILDTLQNDAVVSKCRLDGAVWRVSLRRP